MTDESEPGVADRPHGATRLPARLAPLFGLLLFAGALWLLHRELAAYRFHDVLREFGSLPPSRVLLAAVLTLASYVALTGYDALAVRHLGHALSYPRIALASFVGYAVSNNAGHSLVTGGSVRYRLYTSWGLSPVDVARVVAFCALTFWVGLAAVAAAVFLVWPFPVPESLGVPPVSARVLGAVFFGVAAVYVAAGAIRSKPLRLFGWDFPLPSLRVSLAQLAVAAVDWTVSGAVLYVLLPPAALTFPSFLGAYILANIVGAVSQVPGALGVFEGAFLVLVSPLVPASQIAGALLAYRAIYYLLPLGAAAVLLSAREVLQRKEGLVRVARLFGRWVPEMAPTLMAFATFASGAILLLSGATPAVRGRLGLLIEFLPVPVLEISHFVGSVAGVLLLVLARGLQRRVDSAYYLSAALLATGAIASLLKGLDYEEAIVLGAMLAALVPLRSHFYRRASLVSELFTAEWTAAIAAVLLASVALGLFAYKHVEYSSELWWRFVIHGDASRFMRASVGAVGAVLAVGAARLLRPGAPEPAMPGDDDLARAERIAALSPRTQAWLALLGDKRLLFDDSGESFVMYAVQGRSWVAMGDPVGPAEAEAELAWRFHEMCDRHGGWTVFYEVRSANLPLYLDMGLQLVKLGEEARVPLADFSLEGGRFKELRHAERKASREGVEFRIVPPQEQPPLLADLRRLSDDWLEEKNTREKGFSLGFFDERYLARFPVATAAAGDRILAFANLWPGAGKEELSVDLMRYRGDAPRGIMDFLFVRLMQWGKEQGYRWFNLGMAPLSGLEDRALAPLWNRAGTFLYRHGEHFYNFRGVRQYKEKFDPVWEPRYLASPGGLALPQVLAHIGILVSRGLKGAVTR